MASQSAMAWEGATRAARPAFDADVAMERIGGGTEIFAEVARAFVESVPAMAEELRGALEAGEILAIRGRAHSLRGALLAIAAVPGAEHAGRVEEAARRNELGAARSEWPGLERELVRVVRALVPWVS